MMSPSTLSNWDPILLISQIVSMQSLHYLTLAILVPPLLSIFSESSSLTYEGGAANVGMIMDWREMAGIPTVGHKWAEDQWSGNIDPTRGWVIAFCWMLACFADIYYLYTLVRRPRLILDFALTLVFNHLVLTTYYAASIPTSLFFWLVLISGSVLTIVVAEQMCVRREMTEGLAVQPFNSDEDGNEMEMGTLSRTD